MGPLMLHLLSLGPLRTKCFLSFHLPSALFLPTYLDPFGKQKNNFAPIYYLPLDSNRAIIKVKPAVKMMCYSESEREFHFPVVNSV